MKIYGNPKNKNAIHICPQILNSRGICCCLMNVPLWTTACLSCNSSWSCDLVLQFICSVVSDSLQSHGLQHARPPCPSPTPRVHSNSCLLSQWCHPTISSSVVPFSHLQSFPTSGSFPMSQAFASDGQRIEASAPVFAMNIQDYFLKDWLVWSPFSPRDSQHNTSKA